MTTMTKMTKMTTITGKRMGGVALGIAVGSSLIAIWAATVASRLSRSLREVGSARGPQRPLSSSRSSVPANSSGR